MKSRAVAAAALALEAPDGVDVLSWRVACAPRPIPGEVEWQGPFRAGIFYAACSPGYEHAEYCLERWEALDAAPLEALDDDELERRGLAYAAGWLDGPASTLTAAAEELDVTVAELCEAAGLPIPARYADSA